MIYIKAKLVENTPTDEEKRDMRDFIKFCFSKGYTLRVETEDKLHDTLAIWKGISR